MKPAEAGLAGVLDQLPIEHVADQPVPVVRLRAEPHPFDGAVVQAVEGRRGRIVAAIDHADADVRAEGRDDAREIGLLVERRPVHVPALAQDREEVVEQLGAAEAGGEPVLVGAADLLPVLGREGLEEHLRIALQVDHQADLVRRASATGWPAAAGCAPRGSRPARARSARPRPPAAPARSPASWRSGRRSSRRASSTGCCRTAGPDLDDGEDADDGVVFHRRQRRRSGGRAPRG